MKINYFDGRNNYRMPPYHRLDFGINFHKQKTDRGKDLEYMRL